MVSEVRTAVYRPGPVDGCGGAEKTVTIAWVEESHHQVTVRVPADFDAAGCDLENCLAELGDDGFEYLERSVSEVRDVEHDPAAEFFDPVRHEGVRRVPSGSVPVGGAGCGVLGFQVWLG